MKIRHYLLLVITVLAIGFLQPLIMLIGGVTLITGVLAWIYADLPPEKQNAWEAKLAQLTQQVTAGLRKQPNPPAPVLSTQQLHKITSTPRDTPRARDTDQPCDLTDNS